MALPTDKKVLDMKALAESAFVNIPPMSPIMDILRQQPPFPKDGIKFTFPDHPVIPRKPLVFDDSCYVTAEEIEHFKLTDLTVKLEVGQVVHDWLNRLVSDIRAYNAAREVEQAVASYAEEHQITDFAARLMFKVWMARLTAWGIVTKYAGDSIRANVEYFWRQSDCWCWMFADGYTPSDAILEDAHAAY